MSLQPGSAYVNYLAVKKLLPLDEQANPYPSNTIFAVDASGVLSGYDPIDWFTEIGLPNTGTLEEQIISTIGIIDYGLSSTLYGLVSTSQIVNQYILASSLSSTVAGLTTTTGVTQAQFENRIKNLAAEGYVSSTQLASTVAGLGSAGYLSTSADGTLHVRALSTGSVALSTLRLIDIANPTSNKLLYNSGGGLYFGGSLLGGAVTDLSLNTLGVSTVVVSRSLTAPITYSEVVSSAVVNVESVVHIERNSLLRSWIVGGQFTPSNSFGLQRSTDDGASWGNATVLFNTTGKINNVVHLNGIWYALGQFGTPTPINQGIYYSVNDGISWASLPAPSGGQSFSNSDLYGIAYNGTSYMLVGQRSSAPRIWISSNGINWTYITSPSNITDIRNVFYNGVYWIIYGNGVGPLQYSVDGSSWTAASGFSGGATENLTNCAYNGFTMAVTDSANSQLFYSEDKGVSWTAVPTNSPTQAVAWNGTYFVASTTSEIIYSRDGKTWAVATTTTETVVSIFWNGRSFHAVGATTSYLQSTDGLTWTTAASIPNYQAQSAISYSVYTGDDIITENARYYGVDVPHYYDSTNQIFTGPDRLVLNNTITIKDGAVGIIKGDPQFHLDVEGAIRASTLSISTIQLADPLGQTIMSAYDGMILLNNIPIVQSTVEGLGQTYVSIPSLTSTVEGLGQTYVSIPSLTSTVEGLGQTYVSIPSLTSTVQGLGQTYVSIPSLTSTVQGLGQTYISIPSLTSTVEGLGQTYVSIPSLTSTVEGLGQTYVSIPSLTSTVEGLGQTYVSIPSLTSTVEGLGQTYISIPSLTSTVEGLGQTYVSIPSLISTVEGLGRIYLSAADMSGSLNLISTVEGLGQIYISTDALTSTVEGLGQTYVSIPSLISTVEGLGQIYKSTADVSGALNLISTVAGLGQIYISTDALTSTVEGLGQIYISIPSLTSTVEGLGQLYLSTESLTSTVANLGMIYVSTESLTSTVAGLGQKYVSTDYLTYQLKNLGNYIGPNNGYVSTATLTAAMQQVKDDLIGAATGTFLTLSKISSIIGDASGENVVAALLSSIYDVNVGLSTVAKIMQAQIDDISGSLHEQIYDISSALYTNFVQYPYLNTSLASTVAGLGTVSYLSTPSLTSTVTGLGQRYISIPSLTSTVEGLGQIYLSTNPGQPSTVAGLGTAGYVSSLSLVSTVAGLGSASYISTFSLTSTVAGLDNARTSTLRSWFPSTVVGLGSAGYISTQSLTSTVAGLPAARLGFISTSGTQGLSTNYFTYMNGVMTTGTNGLTYTVSTTTNFYVQPRPAAVPHPILNTWAEDICGNTTATATITPDCLFNNYFYTLTNPGGTPTLSLTFGSNNIPSGKVFGVNLFLTNGGTSFTLPTTSGTAAIRWPGATAPTTTGTNGRIDIFNFVTYDTGTSWFGFVAGKNYQ